MFLHLSVILFTRGSKHGVGVCIVGRGASQGACKAEGIQGRGHARQGAYVVEGMCSRGAYMPGGVVGGLHGRGHGWQGVWMAGGCVTGVCAW